MDTATTAWDDQIRKIVSGGGRVSPRGFATTEIRRSLVEFDSRAPVVVDPLRKLSWKFLSGEALWILSGSDRLEEIAPYNEKMRQYSDDGLTLWGAYGPRVHAQLDGAIARLVLDPDSRQAVVSLWRENPPPDTRDVPCTLALHFSIRSEALDTLALMRSSDAWLGLPYDMFCFTMIGWRVVAEISSRGRRLRPGRTTIFAHSSHIYDEHIEKARTIMRAPYDADEAAVIDRMIDSTTLPRDSRALTSGENFRELVMCELALARDENRPPRFSEL